jgi:hypothetical protein
MDKKAGENMKEKIGKMKNKWKAKRYRTVYPNS